MTGSLEVPDDVALPHIQELMTYAAAHPPTTASDDTSSSGGGLVPTAVQPGRPNHPRPTRRSIAQHHLTTVVVKATRTLILRIDDLGVQMDLRVPDAADRIAVDAMFQQLDEWGAQHDLSGGQVAGVGNRISKAFGVWRRPRN